MNTLRPCPFCGSEDVGVYDGLNYVQCNECGTLGPTAIEPAVPAALWNRRAKPALRPVRAYAVPDGGGHSDVMSGYCDPERHDADFYYRDDVDALFDRPPT